jgi:thioredoxin reductase
VAQLEGPHPPGDYPVVVVGSGPGGLQTSYSLSRLGVRHAVISQDDSPGGMFRRFPIFQRLLSWTKPDAPHERATREYEWYDHNSLVADEPEHRALVAAEMNRSRMVPARTEMERGLAAFAERGGVEVRYGCRWESTRREDDGLVLVTSDGEYRCAAAVFAVGVTEAWRSDIPGLEQVPHYVDCRNASHYRGKRVFVVGKRNSGFELADGLVPWARQVVLASPRPVQASVLALATVRVRYFQPLEDSSWGGGTLALDAALERIERADGRWLIHARPTTSERELPVLEADDVIAATGFRTPLRDLVDLGVATVAQGRIPAQTPFWESVSVPGVYFAGNATQGAAGLRKHGIGSSSGTVMGFRYNAMVLARHLAETKAGVTSPCPPIARDELVPFLLAQMTAGPELLCQRAYLTRVVSLDPPRDEGVQPLAHFVDAPGPDAVAATVEMDAAGSIYPVVYVRRAGRIEEHAGDPHPLHDYRGEEYRRWLDALL